MDWVDQALVLSARKHGESSVIVSVMTRDHGRHAGLVRGGQGKSRRGLYQPGNLVSARWRARLAEQLGTLTAELVRPFAAEVMADPGRLGALSAAVAIVDAALPERAPHDDIFDSLLALLMALARPRQDGPAGWAAEYARWELDLLARVGFGLDLSECAATGATQDLRYVSPKSGRAVSAAAGGPYRDRLLRLPAFLLDGVCEAGLADVLDALSLTGYFLDLHVFEPHSKLPPAARSRLVDVLKRSSTISGGRSDG